MRRRKTKRPTTAQLEAIRKVHAECQRLGTTCCKRPDGIADVTWWKCKAQHYIVTGGWDGNTPLVELGSTGKSWLHLVPKAGLIRVPTRFFDDHDERGCEPFCSPVRQSSRFAWLRADDEGLDELLDDAKHYADDDGGPFGYEGCAALRRSAAATVKAIERARAAC